MKLNAIWRRAFWVRRTLVLNKFVCAFVAVDRRVSMWPCRRINLNRSKNWLFVFLRKHTRKGDSKRVVHIPYSIHYPRSRRKPMMMMIFRFLNAQIAFGYMVCLRVSLLLLAGSCMSSVSRIHISEIERLTKLFDSIHKNKCFCRWCCCIVVVWMLCVICVCVWCSMRLPMRNSKRAILFLFSCFHPQTSAVFAVGTDVGKMWTSDTRIHTEIIIVDNIVV